MQARMSTHMFMRLFGMRDKSGGGKRWCLTEDWGRTHKIRGTKFECSFLVHSEVTFVKVGRWSTFCLALVSLLITM